MDSPANGTRAHPRLLAVGQLHGAERYGRIGERDRQRQTAPDHSAHEPRRMQDAAVNRIRRDVLLAGHVEATAWVRNDLLMAVAVGAADVDLRAAIVCDERRILAPPHAAEILGRLESRRIAPAERPAP